ncbi:hypothetical protein vBRpoPV14_48 [Ruegeria phage vB_RpoP-V14]|uniref:Uncharacterized protein n=4 Tax=Aorunvirus V12 TaxID=2846074 RepID=A0A2Z4QGQ0_9CAUD|nr:hypothetical protein HYP62_gp46 [Ruegeria phage vB_RpoP-V12]AWY08833.1 hypothetical protein vBRpoPV12_46 [Ruegeria phage vB_RpoP-V12]AWY09001.1 hypothetical protein vBRpoPV21_43 [Ruegeria phage vB_RpoP-V21]AWY09562.1 hypothetical protein vBRpoPV17_43 [Ruegeria phage vB_RpoP-V17]AXF42166.1 hypothetical protein vBRpoPV14_48 [Ruegeria phage vB_RpoP-V14]
MEQAIMSTAVVLIGLTLVGLLIQILNQIRLMKTMDRILTMEDRILARLLMADQTTLEMTMEGTPITMEDLILRDLEEQMTGAKTMETMAMETMMTDMTLPTPEKDMVAPTETQTAPTKTARRGKGKVTE